MVIARTASWDATNRHVRNRSLVYCARPVAGTVGLVNTEHDVEHSHGVSVPSSEIADFEETLRLARGEAHRWESLLTRLAK